MELPNTLYVYMLTAIKHTNVFLTRIFVNQFKIGIGTVPFLIHKYHYMYRTAQCTYIYITVMSKHVNTYIRHLITLITLCYNTVTNYRTAMDILRNKHWYRFPVPISQENDTKRIFPRN
jgi:hypothetical protein